MRMIMYLVWALGLIAASIYLFGFDLGLDGLAGVPGGEDAGGEDAAEVPEYIVDPAKLVGGGPGKDGIASIDSPKFVSVEDADGWIDDDEKAMVIIRNGTERAYPLQIMIYHEIVNDIVGGDPVAVTYCPLCDSSLAFLRVVEGEAVEFGVSGKLYNSNLVMYDRKTDSYWSQLLGQAIVGPLAGTELVPVPVDVIFWGDWKVSHPASEVLSRDTGVERPRPYGLDPYVDYYESERLQFPVEHRDDRLHPKAVVFGVEVNGTFKAYLEEDLADLGSIEDEVGGVPIRLEMDDVGLVSAARQDAGEEISRVRTFWFAWFAFHPETGLYEREM